MHILETDDDSNSSRKYYINCQELLNKTSNTKNFLSNIHILESKYLPPNKNARMSEKILMQGILEKYKEVVIKLGITNAIENEWIIYNKLKENKIPGVLKYYCYFHCSEDLKKIVDKPEYICKGPGTNLKVILMDIGIHNLSDFPWKTTESLQSCIKQSLLTVLQAYLSFGFYHEDCHPRNFIIKKTSKTQREYNINGEIIIVKLHGYETFMMDLEESKQNYITKGLYTDLWLFCNKIESQMYNKIDSRKNNKNLNTLNNMRFDTPVLNIKQMLDLIFNISDSLILTHPNIEGGRYKLPWRKQKN